MTTFRATRTRSRAVACVATTMICVALIGAAASAATATGKTTTTTTQPRPSGPAADLSSKITGGNGVYLGQAVKPDLGGDGYTQREYLATGSATSYQATGPLAGDGRWILAPDATAPYRTRVLVRAPKDPDAFSGNVLVEWLNVTGGVDANPEWVNTAEEIVRSGDVWVGVSAQRIGVEGGPVVTKVDVPGSEDQGKGLKAIDPARYGSLEHPGDGFSFDIFTQVARAVRDGGGLDGLNPRRLIATGESQSAFAMVSYYNGVQPLTRAFDGFFVHSRGGIALPIAAAGSYVSIADAIRGTPVIFRDDQDAPVMDTQTETDVTSVLNSYVARQPDNDRFRLWEVAGTAHADTRLIGPNAKLFDCGLPINDGPMHLVAKAALHALKTWLTTGKAPVQAPRIDVVTSPSLDVVRDADGLATGGIRTPPVDVPVDILSGQAGPKPSPICILSGSAAPLSDARLAELYPSRSAYTKRFAKAADATIKAGFVLPGDRAALLDFAQPERVS